MLKFKHYSAIILAIFSMTSMCSARADTVINNYSSQPAQPPAPPAAASGGGCNQGANNESANSGQPAGVYTTQNSNGSSNTVYTTGDKKPFIVDNNCNNSPPVQPYVEYNAPGSDTSTQSGSTSSSSTTTSAAAPAPIRR